MTPKCPARATGWLVVLLAETGIMREVWQKGDQLSFKVCPLVSGSYVWGPSFKEQYLPGAGLCPENVCSHGTVERAPEQCPSATMNTQSSSTGCSGCESQEGVA